MPEDALEQVRLLSNLETSRHKLLQIVLFGQSELDEILGKTSMRQLKDRITHSFRTRPLTPAEVATYISFRMRAAGYRGPEVFTAKALARVAQASGGLTRRINILADKSLLAAFGEGTHAVTPKQVRAAIDDSEFAPRWRGPRALAAAGAIGAAGVLVGLAAFWMLGREPVSTRPSPAAAAPASVPAPAAAPSPVPAPASASASASAPAPAEQERPPPPLVDDDQAKRFAGYSAERQPLLSERLAATRSKLSSAPDERITLELYISENSHPARVERFLERARELVPLENVFIVPVAGGGRYRVWAVYGDYPDLQSAAQAAQRLPPKYQKAFPLAPRTFGEVRRVL